MEEKTWERRRKENKLKRQLSAETNHDLIQVNIRKFTYMNRREWYEDIIDHRIQLYTQPKQL